MSWEFVALDITGATATQNSALISTPRGATGLVLAFEVLSGTDLSLTLSVDHYSDEMLVKWTQYAADDTALTAVGNKRHLMLHPLATATDLGSGINKLLKVPPPRMFRVTVTHGNATAADYKVGATFF